MCVSFFLYRNDSDCVFYGSKNTLSLFISHCVLLFYYLPLLHSYHGGARFTEHWIVHPPIGREVDSL